MNTGENKMVRRGYVHQLCDICCPVKQHGSNIKSVQFPSLPPSPLSLLSTASHCALRCPFLPCASLTFWCAFLPVGIHVHVPDLNPGGLGRCHGPDPGSCRSHVGSGSRHLLHPLPSVCYPGECCFPYRTQIGWRDSFDVLAFSRLHICRSILFKLL